MIRLDLAAAVGGYFAIVLALIIILLAAGWCRKPARKKWNVTDHVRRCPYCGNVFIERALRDPVKCPLCESYLEVPDAPKNQEQ